MWLRYSADVVPAITKRSVVTSVAINCNWKGISNKYALGKCRLHSVVRGEYYFLTYYAWVNIDKDVEVSQELTNEDFTVSLVKNLVAGPQNEEEADGDDDEANEPPPKVIAADMTRSLQQLQQGLLQ